MSIIDVIKYEGNNSTLVWKHPAEDFNIFSQLIVHESQEAIFFKNGQALDLFGPGRYTLETNNIPLLRNLIDITTGGQSPFHAEVYFVNKVEQMAIKWGTDSKVQYMEPEYNFPIQIGASGEMSLQVKDSRKLITQLVGTERGLSQESIAASFRAFLMTKVKSYLAKTIKEKKISVFEIDEGLEQISSDLHQKLSPDFADYGVSLNRFFVTTIVKPDGDASYEKFKSLHFRKYADVADAQIRQQVGLIDQQTQAQRTVIEAEGLAKKRQMEGYTYQQERGFDVAEQAAKNEGAGNFTSAGIGLGMMAGIGGAIGGTIGEVVKSSVEPIRQDSTPQPPTAFCENCGKQLGAGASFCEECGSPVGHGSCSQCGQKFEKPGKFCPKCGIKRN